MWVEVIGLPGVGKTTLIEKHLSEIEKSYKIVQSRKQNFLEKIATKLLYYFKYKPLFGTNAFAKKLAYRHGFRVFQNKSQNIFFFDSGIYQLLLENVIETEYADAGKKLSVIKYIQQPNKIIYVKEKLNVIIKRELNRAPRRFDLDEKKLETTYKTALEWLENELLQNIEFIDTIAPENDLELIEALTREKTL